MATNPENPKRRARRSLALRSAAKSLMWRAAPSLFRRWQKPLRQEFAIGIYTGPTLTRLASPAGVANPVLTRLDVTDVPAGCVADPFLCRADGRWYMFLEVVEAIDGKGVIAVATSDDGFRWTYDRVVLREPFHLSYPYVFEWRGEFYMIPESRQSRSVRMYRAVSFPHRWELARTLLDDVPFVDSSFFRFEQKWWMFAAAILPDRSALMLHYADDLDGPWHAHPANPIVTDAGFPATGGPCVVADGSLVRFAQATIPTTAPKSTLCESRSFPPNATPRSAAAGSGLGPGCELDQRRHAPYRCSTHCERHLDRVRRRLADDSSQPSRSGARNELTAGVAARSVRAYLGLCESSISDAEKDRV